MNQLTTTTDQKPALMQAPSIAHILQAAVQGGVTAENVAVVKELLAMQREVQEHEAKRDFASAFTRLQSACAPVRASKDVPDNSGNIRYSFAPYEEIMRQVAPLLADNGFSVTFDTDIADGRVIATCTLMHISGHSRSNKFACRIGSGPPKSSEAQGDGAATTYAKRFALCNALNIVVEKDTDAGERDARHEGAPITASQAADLRALCEEVGADKPKFLAFAGATSFEEVSTSRLADLTDMLNRKRK